MRALLMSLLLIIMVVLIYTNVTGGEQGTKAQLKQSGQHMSDNIRRMSP
ncbi:hypothetical protein Back11_59940 [Paenibacillus baekrokdamisoli]|uniref:Uncharacterized protein n=1 Tax=Paenibacillus baekrokdamisoli TaxID=1712516 RepID=A0A3G9JNN4_9BACL|nr:hypothetical protein [Paenibacillus baekrokdamisoli]MBB3071313.1 hypothetical protein [Paenibacillus baekrokdamisoli]BBH24649.1 hypothetical protein Back11_59940 [Paenibacillus baekrokdamisoli]